MGAIFGMLRFDDAEANPRELQRMSNVLAHRGPDGRKFIVDGPVGLGHCLMRVNQEDLLESQPLWDREANLTLVADCRIDNREELAAHFGLGAADIRDMPDSAFILRAYKKWGEDCAEHLLGDFAFAIWDGRTKKLVLARDHMGQRSIHYHHGKDALIFSTEIKGLWASASVPRELSDVGVARYFFNGSRPMLAHGMTQFRDIFGVIGGTVITARTNGMVQQKRYWVGHADPAHLDKTEDYYLEQYRAVFSAVVDCRLRRLMKRPALLLSGGFDSAAIAGLAGPAMNAKGWKLLTVTAALAEDYRGPLPSARQWVTHCANHMPHLDVRYFVRKDETMLSGLERAMASYDTVVPPSHYALEPLFEIAADDGARLIMDGHGGDTTLNPRGLQVQADFLRRAQFGRFLAGARARLRTTGDSLWAMTKADVLAPMAPSWLWHLQRAMKFGIFNLYRFANPDFVNEMRKRGEIDVYRWRLPPENQTHFAFVADLLANRSVAAHPAAAQFGLDYTHPLYDKRAVEFGLAIPKQLYVKNGLNRYLARRALADVYPPHYQVRRPNQHLFDPDFRDVQRDTYPLLAAKFEEVKGNPLVARYLDCNRLADFFAKPFNAALYGQNILVHRALAAAAYIATFECSNSNSRKAE